MVVFDDTLHTATLIRLLTSVLVHGLTFDPSTNNTIFSSANTILAPALLRIPGTLFRHGTIEPATRTGHSPLRRTNSRVSR